MESDIGQLIFNGASIADGMAMVKLNVVHWHITDSHSFPLVIESHPDLAKYGAFSERQIYTAEMVKDVMVAF